MAAEARDALLLALVEDLYFLSRIESVAGRMDLTVHAFETPLDSLPVPGTPVQPVPLKEIEARARELGPNLVVVDLNAPRVGGIPPIARLKSDPVLAGVPVIAFGSHVNAELLRAAREAGAEEALAKSRFVTAMGDLFHRYLGR